MLKTIKGIYKNGTIELKETPDLVQEAQVLVTFLDQETSSQPQKQPQPLYGIWQSVFPEDIDVEGILKEVRAEWHKEWER